MSAPLPNALRARLQQYIEEGLSGRAAAMRLKVALKGGASWPLTGFFEELLAQDPDITLFELRDALAAAEGVEVPRNRPI